MLYTETGFAASHQRRLAAQAAMALQVTRTPQPLPLPVVCPLCQTVQACGQRLYWRSGAPVGCEACVEVQFV